MDSVNWPGVMGNPEPQRSVMDQKMQREYGNGVSEAYVSSGIGIVGPGDMGQRSVMDQMLQREFNPYYNQAKTSKNIMMSSGCGSKEGYCGSISNAVSMPMSSSNSNRPNWMISNPNNPWSDKVVYQPLQ